MGLSLLQVRVCLVLHFGGKVKRIFALKIVSCEKECVSFWVEQNLQLTGPAAVACALSIGHPDLALSWPSLLVWCRPGCRTSSASVFNIIHSWTIPPIHGTINKPFVCQFTFPRILYILYTGEVEELSTVPCALKKGLPLQFVQLAKYLKTG